MENENPRDDIYKRIDAALEAGDHKQVTKLLEEAVDMQMDKEPESFEIRYGGTVEERVQEITKKIAAFDEVNEVRKKHGLPTNDGDDLRINYALGKLEALVYGDFIAAVKARFEAVKKAHGEKQQ